MPGRARSIEDIGAIMTISALAGKPAPKEILVDLTRLEQEYYAGQPDMGGPRIRSAGPVAWRSRHVNSPFEL